MRADARDRVGLCGCAHVQYVIAWGHTGKVFEPDGRGRFPARM